MLKAPKTIAARPGRVSGDPCMFSVQAFFSMMTGSNRARASLARASARVYGAKTLETALAIAAGISFVLAVRELRTKRQG